jgi:hypothetical protein
MEDVPDRRSAQHAGNTKPIKASLDTVGGVPCGILWTRLRAFQTCSLSSSVALISWAPYFVSTAICVTTISPDSRWGTPQLLPSTSSSGPSSVPKGGGTIQSTSILPAAVLIVKAPGRQPNASPR